jgi:serine/threonine-protein kinase
MMSCSGATHSTVHRTSSPECKTRCRERSRSSFGRRVPRRAADPAPANATRGTANIEAYDRFLKGRYAFDHFDFASAIALFRQAVARDPRFARAHAYLAMAYANLALAGVESLDSMNALARAAAATGLALDSNVAEGYVAQSFILTNEMRLAEAVRALEKASKIDSSNARHPFELRLGTQSGRARRRWARPGRRGRARDPLSPTAVGILSNILAQSRQYDSAMRRSSGARSRSHECA